MKISLLRPALLVVLAIVAPVIALGQRGEIRIVRSDERELLLDVVPVSRVDTLTGGALRPSMPLAQMIPARASDEVRMSITVPIAIPGPVGNSLEVVSSEYAPAISGRLATMAEAKPGPAMLVEERDGQSARSATPAESPAELHYGGIARDLHVGEIRIAPWRYDRSTGSLRMLRSIRVRVRFAADPGARGIAGSPSTVASAFVNGAAAGEWTIAREKRDALRRPASASARAWMRVDVAGEGLYALSAADFQKAGIDLGYVRDVVIYGGAGRDLPESVTLADSNRMNAVPSMVERDGDGKISRVLFYGVGPSSWIYRKPADTLPQHQISPYVRTSSYLVAIDGEPGRPFETRANAPAADVFPTTGIARLFVEEERVNAIDPNGNGAGSGRIWFGPQLEVFDAGRSDSRVLSTPLPGLDRGGPITYRVRVAHTGRGLGFEANGSVRVSESDAASWEPIDLPYVPSEGEGGEVANASDAIYMLPDASAIGGENESRLRFEYSSGVPARGFIDWYEIHYRRRLQAEGGAISFEAPSGSGVAEYRIAGFGSDDLVGFDVTDAARPVMLDRMTGGSGEFIFRDALHESPRDARRYFITSLASVRTVSGSARATFADLRSRPFDAEIVVITAEELRPAADRYAEYRRSRGRSAAVVTVEEIYTEFAHGNADPTAIRDYLAYAVKNWSRAPRFVVMFGEATYDYRGLIPGTHQIVPTMETPDDRNRYDDISSSAFDDYFARVVGNDRRPDLVIGRLPVESNEEGDEQIEKIRRYESDRYYGVWRQTLILAADDDQPQKGAKGFVGESERLWEMVIPEWIDSRKIYLPAYPTEHRTGRRKPEATRDLDQFLRRGAVLTNWLGHGNPTVWGHENLLERDRMIPTLDNDTALTFVIAATCNFGSFDARDRSGAELFVLNPKGGAIGVLASTRTSYSDANSRMNTDFIDQVLHRNAVTGRYVTVGEALFNVKQGVDMTNVDNDQKYHILGDPVLELDLPDDEVVITRVNNVPIADSAVTVGALSIVTVEGEIRRGAAVMRDFNGYAIVSLYEADRMVKLPEESSSGIYYHTVSQPGGRLFQGPARVVDGRFSGTFRVPKEISFSRDNGRMLVYAFTEKGDAAGATRRIAIYGSDTATITDNGGPRIRIFLDDRTFRAGDLVTPSPLLIVDLEDTSGINASSAGPGHGIEAWIDGNPTSVNLTDRYQTLPTSYQSGSTERRLDSLTAGHHELRVRAWDIFNNPAEATTYFKVAERGEETLQVVDVVNIPNPMSRRTAFTFRHNQTGPLDVEVAIYTVSGRRVRTLAARGIVDRLAQIEWDGTDSDGAQLANGVYLYRLKVTSGENVFEAIEKVVVAR